MVAFNLLERLIFSIFIPYNDCLQVNRSQDIYLLYSKIFTIEFITFSSNTTIAYKLIGRKIFTFCIRKFLPLNSLLFLPSCVQFRFKFSPTYKDITKANWHLMCT